MASTDDPGARSDREERRRRARALAVRALPPLRRFEDERREMRIERSALRTEVTAARSQQRRLQSELEALRDDQAVRRAGGEAAGADRDGTLQYLFIVTYGRSGSTLLQGILDSTPGYLIRGENRDALYRLYQYHSVLEQAQQRWSKGNPLQAKDAWYGIDGYPSEPALAGLRALVVQTLLRPAPDTRVTGFKEIRWWHKDWREYLDFLRRLFPGARFVINVREHEAVSRSKWWARNPDSLRRLATYEALLDEMADYLGDSVYRVNFDKFVADPDVLTGLFEWLGEPFDRARIDATMAIRHSS